MSDVDNVTWNTSTYLVRRDDDAFDVGYKSGEPAKFVAEESFSDLYEARAFAKKLATNKDETSFIEVHGSFADGKHGVSFF